ncbi:MAG: hypothetical protein ACTSR7_18430, partial [Promethearchaeota archaeon]
GICRTRGRLHCLHLGRGSFAKAYVRCHCFLDRLIGSLWIRYWCKILPYLSVRLSPEFKRITRITFIAIQFFSGEIKKKN